MKTLRIIRPGPMTTVQDQGRYGFQDRGVPVSGAMDQAAYRLGNLLAGNAGKEASLEITVGGFAAEFLRDTWFAVTGAEREARLNNQIIPTWSRSSGRPRGMSFPWTSAEKGPAGIWPWPEGWMFLWSWAAGPLICAAGSEGWKDGLCEKEMSWNQAHRWAPGISFFFASGTHPQL